MNTTVQWENWGKTQRSAPVRRRDVGSEEEIRRVLERATEQGLEVKALGSGHSFSGIAVTDGVQITLDGLSGLIGVDFEHRWATFGAGTPLHRIGPLLAQHGLALENMGDIDHQTLAGGFSTGTHGTGAGIPGLAASLVAVRMVTADGRVLSISATENERYWPAVRLGLGALGILTEMTIRCVPSFVLEATERREDIDAVLDSFVERSHAADHFEFFWFPHTRAALTKTNIRLPHDAETRPLGQLRGWVDDTVLANGVFGMACRVGSWMPAAIPGINRLATTLSGQRSFSGCSYDVFISERTVRFSEMEYAVELAKVPEILREIRDLIEARDWKISFPIEVRSARSDDIWLSTAFEREAGYIAIHRYFRSEPGEYFREVEEIFRAHGGRPHWGKMHTADAEYLHTVYPHLAEFVELRRELDPAGLFLNPYLRGVLGE